MTDSQNAGYEKKDINLRKTFTYGIGTIVLLVVCFVALDNYFTYVKETEFRRAVLERPGRELIQLKKVDDSLLTTYELVDTAESRYRIPIEQAMEILVTQQEDNR